MAEWTPKYPINIAPEPDGDNTCEALEKLRDEVKHIYELLNRVRRLDGEKFPPADQIYGHMWLSTDEDFRLRSWDGAQFRDIRVGVADKADKAIGLDSTPAEGGLSYDTVNHRLVIGLPDGEFAYLPFPPGTRMIFAQDVAPPGWKIVDTIDDKLVYISKGSANGGWPGGEFLPVGQWEIDGFVTTATAEEAGAHQHASPLPYKSGSRDDAPVLEDAPFGVEWRSEGVHYFDVDDTDYHGPTSGFKKTSEAGAHTHNVIVDITHDGLWRPASFVCIIAEKE